MKTFALIALVATASAVQISQRYVDETGKVHPFYIPNDESTYEERYKAIVRNQEKKTELVSSYGAHPTNPAGYAWDTHLPKENVDTQPNGGAKGSAKPAANDTAPAEGAAPAAPAAPATTA